jgi:hypothetical protein
MVEVIVVGVVTVEIFVVVVGKAVVMVGLVVTKKVKVKLGTVVSVVTVIRIGRTTVRVASSNTSLVLDRKNVWVEKRVLVSRAVIVEKWVDVVRIVDEMVPTTNGVVTKKIWAVSDKFIEVLVVVRVVVNTNVLVVVVADTKSWVDVNTVVVNPTDMLVTVSATGIITVVNSVIGSSKIVVITTTVGLALLVSIDDGEGHWSTSALQFCNNIRTIASRQLNAEIIVRVS